MTLSYQGSVDIYAVTTEQYIRRSAHGKIGCTNDLAAGEYYTHALTVENRGAQTVTLPAMQVRVDDAAPWSCGPCELRAGERARYHIYYNNMKTLTLGRHVVRWLLDGREVCKDVFYLTRDLDWNRITRLPDAAQIAACRNPRNLRSPYLTVWLDIPQTTRYTEYSVDFRADYLPRGTYCCLGCWQMDCSALKQTCRTLKPEGINAYAGFQNIHDGQKMAIMSLWDLYCTDRSGQVRTLRPKLDHPERGQRFSGEGEGAKCLVPWNWKERHWYRMYLRCCPGKSGTTMVEMLACDLEIGRYELICRYDTQVRDSAFRGPMAVFLENYLPEHAAQIRTLELCNAKYRAEQTGKWHKIRSGYFCANSSDLIPDYAGSYDYGTQNGHLWLMSTGVGKAAARNNVRICW